MPLRGPFDRQEFCSFLPKLGPCVSPLFSPYGNHESYESYEYSQISHNREVRFRNQPSFMVTCLEMQVQTS